MVGGQLSQSKTVMAHDKSTKLLLYRVSMRSQNQRRTLQQTHPRDNHARADAKRKQPCFLPRINAIKLYVFTK